MMSSESTRIFEQVDINALRARIVIYDAVVMNLLSAAEFLRHPINFAIVACIVLIVVVATQIFHAVEHDRSPIDVAEFACKVMRETMQSKLSQVLKFLRRNVIVFPTPLAEMTCDVSIRLFNVLI